MQVSPTKLTFKRRRVNHISEVLLLTNLLNNLDFVNKLKIFNGNSKQMSLFGKGKAKGDVKVRSDHIKHKSHNQIEKQPLKTPFSTVNEISEDPFMPGDKVSGESSDKLTSFSEPYVQNTKTSSMQNIDPEVIFFGDPRLPPPVEAIRDIRFHDSLLFWARHASATPMNTVDRRNTVFAKGRFHHESNKYRLNRTQLNYQTIYNSFESIMMDIEASKAFINSNIDIIPSRLFSRALIAQKLSALFRNNISQANQLDAVLIRYQLAEDQLFFPINIEVQKAETRVMTYLARPELLSYAKLWDEVELSLYFATLLAARLSWEKQTNDILNEIEKEVDETVEYMRDSVRRDLISRKYKSPAVTAQIYLNASLNIEQAPDLYEKVAPELRLLHSIFFLKDPQDIRRFVENEFCPSNNLTLSDIQEKLKLLEGSLQAIELAEFSRLRLFVTNLYEVLIFPREDETVNWYIEMTENEGSFKTYEADAIPTVLSIGQRILDTGNAFTDYGVQVLGLPPKYSNAFSGTRPKGSQLGNWLDKDKVWNTTEFTSSLDEFEHFTRCFLQQVELRMQEDRNAGRGQTRVLKSIEDAVKDRRFLPQVQDFDIDSSNSKVVELSDDQEDEDLFLS